MRIWHLLTLLAVAAGWGFWLVVIQHGEVFPEKVPVHWNIEMEPDAWVSGNEAGKWLMIAPAAMSVLAGLNAILAIFASKTLDAPTRTRLDFVLFAMSLFLLSLNVQLLIAMRTQELPVRIFLGSLFVLFAAIGWAMRGITPNPWIGVRLPWTMSDARAWNATHEFASRVWIIGSSMGLLAVVIGAPPMICLAILMITALIPVPASFWIAKKATQ